MLSIACKEERKPAARRLTLQIGRGRETGTVKAQDWWAACREVAGLGYIGCKQRPYAGYQKRDDESRCRFRID